MTTPTGILLGNAVASGDFGDDSPLANIWETILAIEAEAAPLPLAGTNWLGALVLHAEQVHGCTHTEQLRAEAAPLPLAGLDDALVAEGVKAFRLTRDYVGEELLPALPGWSWFDWTEKALAALRNEGETT